MSAQLFAPLKIRELEFRNRIFVSPMCQYSANDGVVGEWHHPHLGSRAVGGAGLVIVEATGVSPEGRITPHCVGLWNEQQSLALKPIVEFMKSQGARTGIQLAHAGRKASTAVPWRGGKKISLEQGGWIVVAPSAVAFEADDPMPQALTEDGIQKVIADFVASTKLAKKSGFEVIELHMAHGYLLHQFLSPLSNQRNDQYGGSLENRMRLPLQVAAAVRKEWPSELPLFVRLSATDWVEGGWDVDQSVILVKELQKIGVDFLDCSSGGVVSYAKIKTGPGYQVPFAEKIRKDTGIVTGAVGMITEAHQAEEILVTGKADAVLIAREFLRDPYWPRHAAQILGVDIPWPQQYERAKPHPAK
jgi:2,4-dienoyl-CoA reductase-like NADH-dependent reductase (Old Yellow Enzyme family)